ncbi:FAD-dependent oxidoreductase, partial [Candidatus Entotheonella palauensis]
MTRASTRSYDVLVIGAGHAGCEAALAAARMGCATALVTAQRDSIALMPCNPAIGGIAKGHLVREIDALGGEMAHCIDATGIQFRVLNSSKGPAVRGYRAQADKLEYRLHMRAVLEAQANLDIVEALVDRLIVEDGRVCGVV